MVKPQSRPVSLPGTTTRMVTGCGNAYITVNRGEDGKVFEVFARLGKGGGCAAAMLEAICRSVTVGLRAGVEPEDVIRHLQGIRCPTPTPTVKGEKEVLSCADAIATVLKEALEAGDSNVHTGK